MAMELDLGKKIGKGHEEKRTGRESQCGPDQLLSGFLLKCVPDYVESRGANGNHQGEPDLNEIDFPPAYSFTAQHRGNCERVEWFVSDDGDENC